MEDEKSVAPPRIPKNWFKYEFPLPEIAGAPRPSRANYDPENVAWMIEMFASTLRKSANQITFRYENNMPFDEREHIIVGHPGGQHLYDKQSNMTKSSELRYYESKAKMSSILKLYERHSPAQIDFFDDKDTYLPCYILGCSTIHEHNGYFGLQSNEIVDPHANLVNEPVTAHDEDTTCIRNEGGEGERIIFGFDQLGDVQYESFRSVTVRLVDKKIGGTGNSAGGTFSLGEETFTFYWDLTNEYTMHNITWGRDFTKEEINEIQFTYHDGNNPLSFPQKSLTAIDLRVNTLITTF